MLCFQVFLASAMSNLCSPNRKKYTIAKKPGENPITMDEWESARIYAQEEQLHKP